MDYFIMSQDERINAIKLGDVTSVYEEDMDDQPIQIYLQENMQNEYVDLIEKPLPLMSERLKQLVSKYDAKVFFKPTVLADLKRLKQDLYWLFVPETVECLSPKSEFEKNGAVKNLVIVEEQARKQKIFKIARLKQPLLIVSLDLAESILRRSFTGVRFKRIATE